jgi:hypothetical protein
MANLRVQLQDQLRSGVTTITFTKVDGTERVMKATLDPALLPEQMDIEEYISERRQNEEVLAVWDVEKEGWRSFRLENVTRVE